MAAHGTWVNSDISATGVAVPSGMLDDVLLEDQIWRNSIRKLQVPEVEDEWFQKGPQI